MLAKQFIISIMAVAAMVGYSMAGPVTVCLSLIVLFEFNMS
jgi:hypothetical protein